MLSELLLTEAHVVMGYGLTIIALESAWSQELLV